MEPQVKSLIAASGGLSEAVRSVVSFSRAFWTLCSDEQVLQKGVKKDLYRRDIPQDRLNAAFTSALRNQRLEPTYQLVLDRIQDLNIGWLQDDDTLTLRRSVANPLDLVRSVLRSARPDHELKYVVMQNMRQHYRFAQSSIAAHQLHALAGAVNKRLESIVTNKGNPGQTIVLDLHKELIPALRQAITGDATTSSPVIELFLETCRVVNYIRLSSRIGCVEVPASSFDAEFLLSRLFGLPTQIKGLDDLFGGGGIMLTDAAIGNSARDGIGGRAVVTLGPFGSAKSLLSLQMAVEVARKGGIAWVMPLEQSAEECLYTLESMGCIQDDAPFCRATTVPEAIELLEHPVHDKGALILLRTVKEKFEDFLVTFDENVRLMKKYPLRLIIVDPISAMSQGGSGPITEKRGRMLRMFESVKREGTNIWLVAEEGLPSEEMPYEQNIADTVIRLSAEIRHGYSQRYIEITKSRLQREQRGRHAFTVGPGKGITIYPSSASVRSRLRKRSERMVISPVEFGLPSLDQILCEGSLYAGDIVVLQGPGGCSKTQVGLSFLLSADWGGGKENEAKQRPLLVSARDSGATIHHSLERLSAMKRRERGRPVIRNSNDVKIIAIEGGHVKPGYILQRLEDEFIQSRLNHRPIGRVMIDNIAHWEFGCPYIREDETFGDTLIDMLRRHGVTAVLTCGNPRSDSEPSLQRSIIDSADCLIQFERIQFRGASQIMLRVLKTRDMVHRRESFELIATPEVLEVNTASSLVRVGSDGKLASIKVRLFLHAESESQTAYNKSILLTVKSTLSQEVEIESENPIRVSRALSLGESSSVDELQILQIDEFQLPVADRSMIGDLSVFPATAWGPHEWDDIIPRLRDVVRIGHDYFAVPYYQNIGLLAYRSGLPQTCTESWEELSRECIRWEAENSASGDLFFDFPMVSSENYNVMFLEILISLAGPPADAAGGNGSDCTFRDWITSEESLQANLIMYRLCRRAYTAKHESNSQDLYQPAPFQVNPRAQVWRHWYSTLNQMLSDMSASGRADISISPLPGDASVAGEWFLSVPRYSAAPNVGLRLIQLYTSQEADIDRLKYGVGLPVRTSFYASQGNDTTSVSPFFSMDTSRLYQIIDKAFRRSSYGCYRQHASILSTHLQSLLFLPLTDQRELEKTIRARGEGLKRRLAFAGASECSRCSTGRFAKHS